MRALGGAVALTLVLVAVTVWLPGLVPELVPSEPTTTAMPRGDIDPSETRLVTGRDVFAADPTRGLESLQFLAWVPLAALGVRRTRRVAA